MRAIVLKSHHEPTVSRAAMVNQRLASEVGSSSFEVLGGVTLNSYVGGINPRAVQIALERGGRIVWMPTVEAAYHHRVFGQLGKLTEGMEVGIPPDSVGITISDGGRLIQQAVDVVSLVAEHDAVLAGGHLGEDEILLLAEECAKQGAKFLVNHPFFMPRVENLAYYRALVDIGACLELCAVFCFRAWPYTTFEENLRLIEAVGDDRCVFATDAGNVFTPWPHESLRVYLQNLHKLGLSAERIRRLASLNPARLLGIEV
jgi:hypothetical protein